MTGSQGHGASTPVVRALAELARSARCAADLDEFLDILPGVALTALAANSVHVSHLDLANGQVQTLRACGDTGRGSSSGESSPLSDHPQLQVIAEQAPSWRTGLSNPATRARELEIRADTGKPLALSLPILVSGALWGELAVTRNVEQPFCEDELAYGEIIVELAAAAISGLDHQAQLRELAYTDALTGLANRRAADERLERWADVCDDLLLVLCDVNGLKAVNDTHGHIVGDRLIREVALLVSAAASRLPDGFAARIGGDEFLIAAPGAEDGLAEDVVSELDKGARALPFGSGVAYGVATRSQLIQLEREPSTTVRSLLRLADAELYRRRRATRQPDDVVIVRRPAPGTAELADVVNRLTVELAGTPDPASALDSMCRQLCHPLGAAAWWVSEVVDGLIHARRCDTPRSTHERDGQWDEVVVDPTVYRVVDFPASEQAIHGRSFYVDTRVGDPAEQVILAQTGFRSVIATGGPAADGTTWLVELYGDSLTPDLHSHEPLLQALTTLALSGDVR